MEEILKALIAKKKNPMQFTNRTSINGRTIVLRKETELAKSMVELLSTLPTQGGSHRIVALDIEKMYTCEGTFVNDKVALLTLSTSSCCLLIHLIHFKSIPSCLPQFLGRKDVLFYGVGMKYCVECLAQDYGLRIRMDVVDIGELSAQISKNITSWELLPNLFYNFASMNRTKHPQISEASSTDWGVKKLSPKQIVSSTVDALAVVFVAQNLIRILNDADEHTNIDLDVIKANLEEFSFRTSSYSTDDGDDDHDDNTDDDDDVTVANYNRKRKGTKRDVGPQNKRMRGGVKFSNNASYWDWVLPIERYSEKITIAKMLGRL